MLFKIELRDLIMLISLKNIKKRYKDSTILSDISFNIKENEIFGLVGKSGSGKTTLFKIMIGACPYDMGIIFFEGKNLHNNLKKLRKNMGFAAQSNTLFEELSIFENSYYFGKLYGMKRKKIKARFDELSSLLELKAFKNELIRNLSGGMMKRANLLVSLIHSPKLLILDEPTTGLDPLLRKNLWEYIREINKSGTTILVTSHLLDEIEENCNRIAILNHGEIVAIAAPEQYKEKYGEKFEEVFKRILE